MLRRIFYVFVFLFALAAHAKWAECEAYLIHEDSLGSVFVDLQRERQLIHQMDERLAMRNLIVPNGGLCMSTCGVNVLRAIQHYSKGGGKALRTRPDAYIERLVERATKLSGVDAKVGMAMDTLGVVLAEMAGEEKLNIGLERVATSLRAITWDDLKPLDNELVLVVVESGRRGKDLEQVSAHAMVLVGLDLESRTVVVSDPNKPNDIQIFPIRPILAGPPYMATFKIDLPFRDPTPLTGMILDILRISVPRLALPPSR